MSDSIVLTSAPGAVFLQVGTALAELTPGQTLAVIRNLNAHLRWSLDGLSAHQEPAGASWLLGALDQQCNPRPVDAQVVATDVTGPSLTA